MTVDLDQLATAVRAMSHLGSWSVSDGHYVVVPGADPDAHFDDSADAAGVVALVNAAPELLRLAVLGAAYVAWRRALAAHCGHSPRAESEDLAAAWMAATEPT